MHPAQKNASATEARNRDSAAAARAAADTRAATPPSVPIDAALLLQILAGHGGTDEHKRQIPRCPYVVTASLELADDPSRRRRWIYVRDANERGVGFITQDVVGEKGAATLRMPVAGQVLELRCNILRFRKVMGEWYEGAVLLAEEDPRLSWQALTKAR